MNRALDLDTVECHWAISSKTPGHRQGYETKRRLQDRGVAALMIDASWSLGTPAGLRAGHPDALPWWCFPGAGKSSAVAAAVCVDWSEHLDGTDQPISPTRALWLPWHTAPAVPFTYYALYEQVSRLRWPTVDGGPAGESGHRVAIGRPTPDWERVIADIECYGTEFVAEVAAALAAGQQVVVPVRDADPVPLESRVRFLDAVVALLPYGARNAVIVSTWASDQSQHRADLTFATGPRYGQAVALPHERVLRPAGPIPQGPGSYLGELVSLLHDGHPLAALVQRLRRADKPLRQTGDITAEIPSRMRLPTVVHGEVKHNRGTPERVGEALCEIGLNSSFFPEEYRRDGIRFLATAMGTADKKTAKQAREALTAQWSAGCGALLGEHCRTAAAEPATAVGWLELTVRIAPAIEPAAAEYLIAALGDTSTPRTAPVFDTLVALVLRYFSAVRSVDERVLGRLVRQPHVLAEALCELVLSPRGTSRFTAWLPGQSQRGNLNRNLDTLLSHAHAAPTAGWVRPILLAATGERDLIHPADVRALLDIGAHALETFVRVLFSDDEPEGAIALVAPLLAEFTSATDGPGSRTRVSELVELVCPRLRGHRDRLPDSTRAAADLWELLRERPGPALPTHPVPYPYRIAFERMMGELNGHWRTRVARHLAQQLVDQGRTPITQLDEGRMRELVRPHYLEQLARAGRTMTVAAFLELERALPAGWRHELKELPEMGWFRALSELEYLVERRAAAAEIADAARRVLGNDGTRGEVVAAIRRYLRTAEVIEADALLMLLGEPGHGTVPHEVAFVVLDSVAAGDCGADFALRLGHHIDTRMQWYQQVAQRLTVAPPRLGRRGRP